MNCVVLIRGNSGKTQKVTKLIFEVQTSKREREREREREGEGEEERDGGREGSGEAHTAGQVQRWNLREPDRGTHQGLCQPRQHH